jgi:hypothetical protein
VHAYHQTALHIKVQLSERMQWCHEGERNPT